MRLIIDLDETEPNFDTITPRKLGDAIKVFLAGAEGLLPDQPISVGIEPTDAFDEDDVLDTCSLFLDADGNETSHHRVRPLQRA